VPTVINQPSSARIEQAAKRAIFDMRFVGAYLRYADLPHRWSRIDDRPMPSGAELAWQYQLALRTSPEADSE
jgi:hypothetical protein